MAVEGNRTQLSARSQWKGSAARPRTIHQRVTRRRGRASDHQCVRCPARGRDWARVHTEDGQDPWADYVPLCRSCHRHYDRLGPRQAERKRREAAHRMRDAAGKFIVTVLPVMLLLTALAVWPAPTASAASTPLRLRALHWAEAHAGAPYVWGGTGPWGFDCSGLVMEAYAHAGVRLPRTTYGMLASGLVRWIPASQRQRGDLAFYGSGHVELVTARGTFGALDFGTLVGWHHPSGWWQPTEYARVL